MLFSVDAWRRCFAKKQCDCGWLSRVVQNPDHPVIFNDSLGEYHLRFTGADGRPAFSILRYCPNCGRPTPKSKRDSFFESVPQWELWRLWHLTWGVTTLERALDKFGEPDADYPQGSEIMSMGEDGKPTRYQPCRVLRYNRLSKTAVFDVMIYPSGEVEFSCSVRAKATSLS